MNARLRSIIALLLVLSFGLALPAVHGQQLMIHMDAAATPQPSEQQAGAQQIPPCHGAADEATTISSDGCSQCGDGDCQCQLITLSPLVTLPRPLGLTPAPALNSAAPPEAPSLGQLRHPWRPPSTNS